LPPRAGGGENRGVKRRDFLVRAGAVAVAPGALAACAEESAPAATGWAAVRGAFELRDGERNFAAWYLASHPKPVRDAIARHRRGLDADAHEYVQRHGGLEAEARAAAARYLGTDASQIALTDSTTMGLGLLYGGIALKAGQELVTSTHDFYATHEALRLRTRGGGATVTKVDLYSRPDEATADEILSNVELALGPRTRVLALTWVHSSTGVKLPVREIARIVADKNRGRGSGDRILFCLDAVHGFGVEGATPAQLGVDFLVSGCHKWLFGPRGTGLVWGRNDAWAEVNPTIPTFDDDAIGAWLYHATNAVAAGPFNTPGGFHSFEHRWALKEAFTWRQRVGRARVEARTHALARRLKERLAASRKFAVVTPRDPALSAGLVMLTPFNREPADVVERLRAKHRVIATVTPYRTQYVRLGPSIVNDEDDVDAAARAVHAVT
jgi:selenocysteine lyase/cysteine desulfurase